MKGSCITDFTLTSTKYLQNCNAISEKGVTQNIVFYQWLKNLAKVLIQVVMLKPFWQSFQRQFDYINHVLLIAKLNTYGVDKVSQDLLLSYLTKRKRIKINMSHSEFEKSTSCVSQGSIFNISILFNI